MERQIGPYKLIKKIGTGGMGEVFQAHDHRLDRIVAIKCIRPGKEDTDENRERFEREAKATAKLNHPSIVHVYDTLPDGDSHCIVMEYIEGLTLQSKTADGPLDPHSVIELGKEIAEGLAAAHAKKILHRDLKTENIMVTPEGRAKILDFGLAKPLISQELDSSLTGKGQLVGTSRAMSPEYVGGDEVDHRSDLFAFGVLLYEVSTGHSPFKAQNTLATLKQVIVHQQPPVRELNPEIPQEFSDLVDQLLEKSPEDRPQSANVVAAELAKISGYYSSGVVNHSTSPASGSYGASEGEWSISTTIVSDPRLRRYWFVVVAVIVAGLVGAYFLGRGGRLEPPASGERYRIVLGEFENLTNDPVLDYSLDIAFKTGLEQSPNLDILSAGQIEEALKRMEEDPKSKIDQELGVEICQREGAQALVIGNIITVGPTYSISAQIIGPSSGKNLFTSSGSTEKQGEILKILNRIIGDLRGKFGESLAEIESSLPLDKVTTPDLEALKLYSFGVREHRDRNFAEAISRFEKALERDPQFAMAHAKLALTYLRTGPKEKVSEHFNLALKYKDRLSSFEEHYIEGWNKNRYGTPKEMIDAWEVMTSLFPKNQVAYHNIGMVQRFYLNQFGKAAEAFRNELQVLDTQNLDTKSLQVAARPLGYCEIGQGKYDEARSVFEANDIMEGLADVFVVQGQHEEGLKTLEAIDNTDTLLFKAQYFIDQGQLAKARPLARQYVDIVGQHGAGAQLATQMTLIATYLQSKNADLHPILEDSLQMAEEILRNKSASRLLTPIPFMATLGKIRARRSETDHALVIYELIREQAENGGIDLWKGYLKMLEGEILISRGKLDQAIPRLEEAVTAKDSFQAHESLAHALELRGDIPGAVEEYLWISQRRGRVFSECHLVCGLRAKNILDWNLSLFSLGRLYEADGQADEALKYYRRFAEQWTIGDLADEAADRIQALELSS